MQNKDDIIKPKRFKPLRAPSQERGDKLVSMYITPTEFAWLEAAAAREFRSLSAQMRSALREQREREERKVEMGVQAG